MNIREIIDQLRAEHELISVAIAKLEAVIAQRLPGPPVPKRRGRPPGSKNKPRPTEPVEKEKPSKVKET
jgi:hypothetical protein